MTYKRFTVGEINKADTVSIIDYINKLNLETKRAGKTLKVEGYGGLYIDPTNNRWNCFSEGKGGGPIQLAMFLENKTWVESIKTLLGNSYESNVIQIKNKKAEKENNKEFILPKKNTTYNHIIAYLIKTRAIDKDVVYKFIQNKTLYEDEKRNCVFVGYDNEGVPRYGGLRGTNTSRTFKGEIEGSNKAFSFNSPGKTNKLYIFESPIELMSYLTLFQNKAMYDEGFNHHMLSLGCLAPVALDRYLKDNPNIDEINICLDNDKWGIDAAKNIRQEYQGRYRVSIEYPNAKDWNEFLVQVKKTNELSKMEVAKNLIMSFIAEEYDEELRPFDYEDMEHIGIAHTTTEDGEYDINIELDLISYKINKYANGNLLHTDKYDSLDSFVEELRHLNFDDLVYYNIQDKLYEKFNSALENIDEWDMEL